MKPLPFARAARRVKWLGLGLSLLCVAVSRSQTASSAPAGGRANASLPPTQTVSIPGPLRSFLRMAGISDEASPREVLPLLAYQVFQEGYRNTTPTEFLLILQRYMVQARELQYMAGPTQTIKVSSCSDASALLGVLGYRLRGACGPHTSLETANPERAFLTIDSGFPLMDLEDALQHGTTFTYPYGSSPVPLLFTNDDWLALRGPAPLASNSSLDTLLSSPHAARLYMALSRMDAETRNDLKGTLGLPTLETLTPALAFYGTQISIRSGHVLVPGGAAAEPTWRVLAGADPASPAKFVTRLLTKDDGWLAAYFDSLSREHREQQGHLTQPERLQRDYEAFRNADLKTTAFTGVARPASDLLVLHTRATWEANGEPHVPGGLDEWNRILLASDRKDRRSVGKRARSFADADQLLEAMTALSRREADSGPLQLYLNLCEIDGRRASGHQLTPATVRLMAANFLLLHSWYPVFSEFPALDDRAIEQFLVAVDAIDGLRGNDLRANAMGALQANMGLWQILARQGEIAAAAQNASFGQVVAPFAGTSSSPQLFDAIRTSFHSLLVASGADPKSAPSTVVDLLAGPVQDSPEAVRSHDEIVARMRSVLEDQRLVSLDTLFALSDGLAEMQRTGKKGDAEMLSLAGELRGFDLPRPIFSNQEKLTWAPGVYASHHAELQVQTDLTRVMGAPGTGTQLEVARGQLTPFLRDALVGLNYAFYEPPGAQILHVNSLFVRTHDFLGASIVGGNAAWQTPTLLGAGVSAGGGAYLMGSLADLPYALASAEAEFIVPEHVQALIWQGLAPGLLAEATLTRWWRVTPEELHAVAVYQRFGDELLADSAKDPELRADVVQIFSDQMSPQRLEDLQRASARPSSAQASSFTLMPSESFYVAEEYHRRFPEGEARTGPAGAELTALAQKTPEVFDAERLSADFGAPHPTLTRSSSRELLHLQPFPFVTGVNHRLFVESLESINLYWARLADEAGYSPAALNRLAPELTRHMIGKIFATNLEDWPAVQRAMQGTRVDLREGKIAGFGDAKGSPPSPVAAATGGGNGGTW